MGVVTRAIERRARWQTGGAPRDPAVADWFGGGDVADSITPSRALQLNTVLACVRFISETFASLPVAVYRRLPDREKEQDPEHPLYAVLHDKPNGWQTSFEWRDYSMHSFLLRGFAASMIMADSTGYPFGQLVPMHPDRVTPFRAPDGTRAYRFTPSEGPQVILLQDEVLYVPFLPGDGYTAKSVIEHAAESIGVALAAQRYDRSVLKNGANPAGVLMHPGALSDEALKFLRASWNERHQTEDRAGKIAVLREGMKFEAIGIKPQDAQLLETLKWGAEDVARAFGVKAHKVNILDHATFSNIEHQAIESTVDTFRPLCVRWEQAMLRDLFTETGRKTHFIEFDLDGLLRGDFKTRMEGYQIGVNNGFFTPNYVAKKENIPPFGPAGDVRMIPLNLGVVDENGMTMDQRVKAAIDLVKAGFVAEESLAAFHLPQIAHTGFIPVTVKPEEQTKPVKLPTRDLAARRRREAAFRGLLEDTVRRITRRNERDAGKTDLVKARQRDAADLLPVVQAFARSIDPGLEQAAEAYSEGIAQRGIVDLDDEMRRMSNAMAHALGSRTFVQGADCESCCTSKIGRNDERRHPPYHAGCTCDIVGEEEQP